MKRLFDIPEHQNKLFPKTDSIAAKIDGKWQKFTTQDLLTQSKRVSLGLLGLGITKGDRVGIISMNRPEWNFIDYGILQLGAINVPIYPTSATSDVEFILGHSEVKVLFVETVKNNNRILEMKSKLPKLEHIIALNPGTQTQSYLDWMRKIDFSTHENEYKRLRDSVESSNLASIIYTSGTTGTPKGVMLTHASILSNILATQDILPINSSHRALSFLPLCHIFERMVNYTYQSLGVSIYYAESIETIVSDLKVVKPHVFVTVPRLLEKMFNKIVATGEKLSGVKRTLFKWALELGLEYDDDKSKKLGYGSQLALAQSLVFNKWREALGGEIKLIISGGAALQPRLAKVFWAAGIPVLEGYGLTETSPVISVNLIDHDNRRIGTVGPVISGVEVKLQPEESHAAHEGEICVRGPSVMKGYYKNEEATAEVIDGEGWFHTGDIGTLVDNKFLKITDRKKEIFKTSGGKYVAPLPIENRLKESNYVEQAWVTGENQKFPCAIIVPAFDEMKRYCKSINLNYCSNDEMAFHPKIRELFSGEIKKINEHLGSWEMIKHFELVADHWTIDTGELTPKLSLKRRVLREKYKELIIKIYKSNDVDLT
ncbi:MAG: long-chain fatty acid--CoA ligase [Xanthomonadaceae bacterium]|nr:long-chain fatty acid--CoA ligase [Xanthomonadaceae bacterium]